MGKAIGLAGVAVQATGDNVFPARLTPAMAWDDVVEVQAIVTEAASTILAGVVVAFKNALAVKFQFFDRQAIEVCEQKDPGNADVQANGAQNGFLFTGRIFLAECDPFTKIKDLKLVGVAMHHAGMFLKQ